MDLTAVRRKMSPTQSFDAVVALGQSLDAQKRGKIHGCNTWSLLGPLSDHPAHGRFEVANYSTLLNAFASAQLVVSTLSGTLIVVVPYGWIFPWIIFTTVSISVFATSFGVSPRSSIRGDVGSVSERSSSSLPL